MSMLLSGMKDPSPLVRVPVTRLLGRLEDVRVAGPLLSALEDTHWKVRRNAENALVSMGPDVVPQLLDELAAAEGDRLLLLIMILAEIGDARAEEPLKSLRAGKKGTPEVRAAIGLALGTIAAARSDAG